MAKKFYVVWAGRQTGIFTDWATTQKSVDKFPGAKFKSFPTREAAQLAFENSSGPGRVSKSPRAATTKNKSSATNQRPASGKTFDVQIYCDGACDPNPGKAGSGIAVYHNNILTELWYGQYNPNGTNNTAELNALYRSLQLADKALADGQTVEILCDSMYSINCIKTWAPGWQKRGWTRAGGELKNVDIIKPAFALYGQLADKLQLSHVKAHAGTEGNELADRMSIVAVDKRDPQWCQYLPPYDIPALLALRAG